MKVGATVFSSEMPERFENLGSTSTMRVLNDSRGRKFLEDCLEGNVSGIREVFCEKRSNVQTDLMREMITSLLRDPESVTFHILFGEDGSKIRKVTFRGKEYDLDFLLRKIKWDFLYLSSEELDLYRSLYPRFADQGMDRTSYFSPDRYNFLHVGEKEAVNLYTTSVGFRINSFLRGRWEKTDSYGELLLHTAVICSALNKIPFSEGSYLYRSLYFEEGAGSPETYVMQSTGEKSYKEPGFTSLSQKKITYGRNAEWKKIYVRTLAKDISGLSAIPEEREYLALPGMKEKFIKGVLLQDENRIVFLVKEVSKRKGLY